MQVRQNTPALHGSHQARLQLANERVLVTGGSGFLGAHLCRRLGNEGAEVHSVSRSRRASTSECVRWWQGDVADIAAARALLHEVKPDVIFHLSGLATASPEREFVLPTLHSLLISAVNVLTIAGEIDCRRVILAASLTEPEAGASEVTPGSPYAAAKWASGAYARMFHKLYGTPVVMVRPFMTYGPGQEPRKLVPHVILSLLKGQAPKLSSGRQEVDWIYIDDVIDGFLAAVRTPDIEGRTIDLGSGVLVSIRSVVGQIVELIDTDSPSPPSSPVEGEKREKSRERIKSRGKVAPLFNALPDRPCEPVRVAGIDDAYKTLGWKPRTPLAEGLRQTIRWYKGRLEEAATSRGAGLA